MIRAMLLLAYWALGTLLVGPPGLLVAWITGSMDGVYRAACWIGISGVRLMGVKVEALGLEHLERGRTYIFMSNHVSNLDPPVLIPTIPGRCSVLVKKELFRVPILGTGMKMAHLVPVDRSNRESAIESVNAAIRVVQEGYHLVIYPEGTRSLDGRLLPFKKGPFHLAMDSGVPVVPVTICGTHEAWPKGRFAMRRGKATVIFHPPLDPHQFADKDDLMAAVTQKIESRLPAERR